VSTLDVVDEVGLNEAVTPLGAPDAAKLTLPENGLTSVTVMVSVPLAPCAIDNVEGDAARVKLPVDCAVTVKVIAVDAVNVPEVPVMVIE
jgi:hypothetical protein